jgi:hypothetical protein
VSRRRLFGWLLEPSPHSERIRYRLGRAEAEDDWRRPTRIDVAVRSLRRRLPSPEKWLYRAGLRDASSLGLPDLLCIGAQKSGTTWLHKNLEAHPAFFVPPHVKEVHYFDFFYQRSLAEYAAVFAAGRDLVKCDVTPNYGRLHPRRIRLVRSVMPDVRLVLILRNPVERAWSQAVMDLATRSGRTVGQVPEAEWLAHFRSPAVQRNGRYGEILDRWLAAFPAEQLLVEFYEDVIEEPRALLGRVFAHAGVSGEVDWEALPYAERFNVGEGDEIPAAHRACLEEIFSDEIARLGARLGGRALAWR